MKFLTRTIWILSVVSLFTDAASEMLYPVMPLYLKSIGFSVILIGILEGLAEATAGLSKGYFGELSDKYHKRAPFVQWGYILSTVSKPMMAVFTFPVWVFFARTIERLGKGVRTAARDAMLSDEATPETKGKVFGFHKSMDTFGAVIGPLAALSYLYFNPENYKALFFIAVIPGLIAVAVSLFLKDKAKQKAITGSNKVTFFSSIGYWKRSNIAYRQVLRGLLLFALFNSSDAFLILKIKQAGLNDTEVIGLYIFYNLVFALLAYPAGYLADKIGLKKMFLIGVGLFSLAYFGMAFSDGFFYFSLVFFIYGCFAAATDGIQKAWISNISNKSETATAIGLFSGLQSICMMLASSFAGLIWFYLGAEYVFVFSAIVGIIVILYFLSVKRVWIKVMK